MPFGDRLSPLTSAAPESLLLKFVAHHLWDPVRRAETPTTACRLWGKAACG